jgi:hypothetical protein
MTPIAHSAAGLLGWRLGSERKTWKTLFLFLLIANLPDIDILFSFLFGKSPVFVHQAYTHNLLFVLITSSGLSIFFRGRRERLAFILTALSHFPLDVIVLDTVSPVGFRLLYPFSAKLFYLGFFPYAEKSHVFSSGNLLTYSLEILLFFLPVLMLFRKSWIPLVGRPEFWKK